MKIDYENLYNGSWFLVFFHDSNFGNFKTNKEASFSLNKNKYSVLKRIDETFKINGVFEFLLMYPNATGQNHWTQTVSPAYAQPNEENGYKEINVSWTVNGFHGLSLSNASKAYIDGSPFEATCYYAIGSKYTEFTYLPADTWGEDRKRFYQVFLWLRVNEPLLIRKLFNMCTFGNRKRSFNPFRISLMIIISKF